MSHSPSSHNHAPESPLEMYFGAALAVFAAVLAINELGGQNFEMEGLNLSNEKTSAYVWYQSKGIKETLAEGQQSMLRGLMNAGAIQDKARPEIQKIIDGIDGKLARYAKEKKEILLGSATVGKENWAQEVDGQMGKVVGAKEIETRMAVLHKSHDHFDLAALFLQLCLVLGAIGILMKRQSWKKGFLISMTVLGILGTGFSVSAYLTAW